MGTKLILIGLILIFVPPICWYFIGRKRRSLGLILVVVWLLGLFLGYPVISFAWAISRITQHFDHNCPEVIRLSEFYAKVPYISFQSNFIAMIVGGTPRYYYLGNIAHCEQKIGTIRAGIRAYEDLRNYVAISDYDRHELPSINKVLLRLRSDLQDHDKMLK